MNPVPGAGARRRAISRTPPKVDAALETDVTLPNISCKRCTLQVIQFMEQHGPNNPGHVHLPPLRHGPDHGRSQEGD